MRFIDLFCGIGGFRLALEKEGLDCVFSSEIDKHAKESYRINFGEDPMGDITKIQEKNIPKHDILCAGFPCQSFSISGKKMGIQDERGRLFYEIIRIAQYHRPYAMLLENVKNIISMDGGRTIEAMKFKLEEIGYTVYIHLLNASHFGIPQSRERVYFVCLRKGEKYKKSPKALMEKIYLENIMEKNVDQDLYIKREAVFFGKKTEYALKPVRVGIVNKGGQGERIYTPKGHAITLSAYGGGVGARTGLYLDEQNRVRRLSVLECKRLMGFPDKHHVSAGMQGYQQLGNAVIPSMVNHVYECIGNS